MGKYIKLCVDMMGAIERKIVTLDDGEYLIEQCEISYCPWCGKELLNYEKVAMGDLESESE